MVQYFWHYPAPTYWYGDQWIVAGMAWHGALHYHHHAQAYRYGRLLRTYAEGGEVCNICVAGYVIWRNGMQCLHSK